MNYYLRHIGDYLKDTSHLSLLEHGVYTRLLDVYYTRESGIPMDEAARLVGARTREEKAALTSVLQEFFTLNDDRVWIQDRAQREIARCGEKSEKARRSAEKRWSGNANAMRTHSEGTTEQDANALPRQSDGNAPNTPLPNTTPLTPRNRGELIPYDEIVTAYNATMTRLPKVLVLNDARKRAIRRAWEESPQRRSVEEFWVPYFEECEASSFHNGTGPYTNGHENWRPDFDFLVQPKTITKVYERAMQRVERRAGA